MTNLTWGLWQRTTALNGKRKPNSRPCAPGNRPSKKRAAAKQKSARTKAGKRKPDSRPGAPSNQPIKDPNRGYWNPSTQEWSKKLLSCRKEKCCELPPTEWDDSLKRLASNAWFTVRAKKLVHQPDKPSEKALSHLITDHLDQKTAASKPKPKPKPSSPSPSLAPVKDDSDPPKKKK